MNRSKLWSRVAMGLLAVLGLIAIAWLPLPFGRLGQADFFPYWTASYVLVNGGDPYSTAALDEAFRAVRPVEYAATEPVFRPPWALGPPWTLLLVAPLGWLPFEVAARLWLLVSILLIGGSALMLWPQVFKGKPLTPLIVALSFVPTLIVITLGQIAVLVLVGLVICVGALQTRRDDWAGVGLLLMLSKPQLMYLAAPSILIWAAWRGRWGVWRGAAVALILSLGVLSVLLPDGLTSYLRFAQSYDFFRHAAATIGGVVRAYWHTDALRWLGVLAVPLLPWLVRLIDRAGIWTGVNAALLIALPLALYGWNYDHIVLIPAILQAVIWAGRATDRQRRWLLALLAAIYGLLFVMRLRGIGEFLYVWVPIAVGIWYARAYQLTHARLPD